MKKTLYRTTLAVLVLPIAFMFWAVARNTINSLAIAEVRYEQAMDKRLEEEAAIARVELLASRVEANQGN